MNGKVAIVTGGTSGIGKATVYRFAKEGMQVVFTGRSDNRGQAILNDLKKEGITVDFYRADVNNYDEIGSLFEYVINKYGEVNVVCAAAGIAKAETIDTDVKEWSKVIDTNLNAVYETNRLAIKQMLKQENGGAIVNLGSVHSFVATPQSSAYSASKGGIKLMTQSLAVRYAKDNIRINSVCPGYIETNMTKDLDQDYLKALHPIGRLGKPEEIANVINFLSGPEASFITGESIIVDGGYSMI